MQIASSTSAAVASQLRPVQAPDPARAASVGGGDGPDRENDGDQDDGGKVAATGGNVTATRGQNVNILA